MRNFASAAIKSKVRGKHEKVVELKTTRDLLGRLVYLACTRKIELERVFPFPLTPNIAELILRIICSTKAHEVHFVCDSYVKSITNIEQQARGASDGSFHITGADQLRPKDFRYALRSPSFKTALLKFFMEE